MKLNRTVFSATFAVATVIGGSADNQAASITQTVATYSDSTPCDTDLATAKFDTSIESLPGTSNGGGTQTRTVADNVFLIGDATVDSYTTAKYDSDAVPEDAIAVPEPTSSAIFGIGIILAVGLGWGRKRRELNKITA